MTDTLAMAAPKVMSPKISCWIRQIMCIKLIRKTFCLFFRGWGRVKVINLFTTTSSPAEYILWILDKVYLHAAFPDSSDFPDSIHKNIINNKDGKKVSCLTYNYHWFHIIHRTGNNFTQRKNLVGICVYFYLVLRNYVLIANVSLFFLQSIYNI